MAETSQLDKFWMYVSAFGTLWGGIELTLGTFLHVLHVPKTGLIMGVVTLVLILAQRYLQINGVWEDHIHMVRLNDAWQPRTED